MQMDFELPDRDLRATWIVVSVRDFEFLIAFLYKAADETANVELEAILRSFALTSTRANRLYNS